MAHDGKRTTRIMVACFVVGLLLAPQGALAKGPRLLGPEGVLAKGLRWLRGPSLHAKYGTQRITPKNTRPYNRRGPTFDADRATYDGYTWVKGRTVKGEGYQRAHLKASGQGWDRVSFLAGTHVSQAAAQVSGQAQRTGRPVMGLFSGTLLYAKPGDSAQTVEKRWDARTDKKYAKYRKLEAARQARWEVKRAKALSALSGKLVSTPPAGMTLDPYARMEKSSFFNDNAFPINLITPQQLRQLPKGTVLHSISGNKAVVGVDRIDGDTRGGFLAYGFQVK